MKLILVRHGVAQPPEEASSDYERNITKKGREKLLSQMPGFLLLSGASGKSAEIWYSPKHRTTQTAEIIKSHMPDAKMRQMDFIAFSDFESFRSELKKTDPSKLVIVCGHEPGMSLWTGKISGCIIGFKKGACAGFEINDLQGAKGNMEWFLQPSTMIKIGEEV